ncbi:Zinc finger CCCH protein [Rhizoctonia solani]|nr:Zinc finger CCCH protein [Rhizoctonia solani]
MHPLFRTRECKYWAAGRCNQGDECPFKHTYGDDVEHGLDTQGQAQDSRENPYWRIHPARPCKWFQQGQCLRGDNCNYLHTLETPTPVVCKFYPTPGCRNGSECPFVHTDDKAAFEGSESSGGPSGNYETSTGENGYGEHTTYGAIGENGKNGFGHGIFGQGVFGDGANGLFVPSSAGLYENGMFHGYSYQPNHETDKILEDEDSDDDVIFEPMRSTGGVEARSPGGLSMLLSGLALNGHAQAQAQAQVNKAN